DHCNKFIEKNRASVLEHVQNEIRTVEGELEALDGQEKGKARKDTNDDKLGFSESWSDNYGNEGSNDSFEGVDWDATDNWEELGRGWDATGYWENGDEGEDEDEDASGYTDRVNRLRVSLNDRLWELQKDHGELQRGQGVLLIEP
ncbi:hypothetical protein BGX30_007026, partial [Mortierella sp. GBA39]